MQVIRRETVHLGGEGGSRSMRQPVTVRAPSGGRDRKWYEAAKAHGCPQQASASRRLQSSKSAHKPGRARSHSGRRLKLEAPISWLVGEAQQHPQLRNVSRFGHMSSLNRVTDKWVTSAASLLSCSAGPLCGLVSYIPPQTVCASVCRSPRFSVCSVP